MNKSIEAISPRADSREFPTGNSREFPEKNENRKFPGIFQISREFSGNFYSTVGPNFDENSGKFDFFSTVRPNFDKNSNF